MSSQPSTLQALEPHWVQVYAAFIKAHERLLITLLLVLFGFFGYSKAITAWEAYDKRHVALDQQKIDQQHQENVALAQQLAELKLSVDNNAKITDAKIAAMHQQTKKQQETDMTLPLPQLGERWVSLLSLPSDSIAAAPDNKMVVTESAARTTVSELERIPDLSQTVLQREAELAGCNQVRAKQDEVIAGVNNELTLEKKGRADDAKLAKAAQRKSWLRGFKWGFIGGFISGLYVGHHI